MRPGEAARLFERCGVPWWIAGGWALDLFCGPPGRPHGDLDIGVLRADASEILKALSTWEIFQARNGRLTRLANGDEPRPEVHSLWCRPRGGELWQLELMLDDGDRDIWRYRRNPQIKRPTAALLRRTLDGLPYLAPEVQLLYKSKSPRERDEADFARIHPLLDPHARSWLRQSIQLVHPRHRWLHALARS